MWWVGDARAAEGLNTKSKSDGGGSRACRSVVVAASRAQGHPYPHPHM
jgi:hypothetical protein